MPSSRGRRFGAAAAAYERYRPGYPDALVSDVLAYAGRPVRRAVEIGAGTGKATRVFAELRRHVPDSVTTVQGTLEELRLDPAYDLLLGAASRHWTEPEGPWARIAGLLAPGGVVASFDDVRQSTLPVRTVLTPEHDVGLVDRLGLPPAGRAGAEGGARGHPRGAARRVEVVDDVMLHLARRR